MKRLIAKVLELDLQKPDNHVREDKSKMLNTIVKSEMTHIIEFDNVKNGDKVCLEYQHTYNRRTKEFSTTTTEQRPDILVTIKKKDGFVLTYLYDAKYRVQDDARDGELDEGVSIDVADYPLPDAINQMHRYRDAIYYSMKTEVRPSAKEIIGGYILFPGRVVGDEIYGRYFYQSIRKVNIGAFPLLPATKENEDDIIQCDLLERHLREILLEDSVYEHVKDSIPQKGLVYGTENVFVLAVDRDAYDDYEHNRFSIEIPLDINKGMFKIDSIDYFMFIVENASEGYYRVTNSRLRIKDDKLVLALSLTDYQSFGFGFKEVAECDTKTIVSLRDLLNVR